jgi:hypothetical protein
VYHPTAKKSRNILFYFELSAPVKRPEKQAANMKNSLKLPGKPPER